SLYNGASYQNTDGRKVLYLNGSLHSYAETPALPIRAISFSIMCWIKVLSLPSNLPVYIYSDWSEPHQFRIFIQRSYLICANLRKRGGLDRVYLCAGKIIPSKWMHVALTWSREKKEGILYIDGIIQGCWCYAINAAFSVITHDERLLCSNQSRLRKKLVS
ncbi:unnamed protein product, partial [Pocillopora meandrina]